MKSFIKKLPLSTIIVALILAIGLILFVGTYAKRKAFSLLGGKETIVESQAKDTDNDGLLDWEEELLETNPLNPDTDGDGYLDGEEIASGHNPLVKGPGDETMIHPLPLGKKYNITQAIFQDSIISTLDFYLLYKSEYLKEHSEITDPLQFLASVPQSTRNELIRRAVYDNFLYVMDNSREIFSQFPEIFDITISDQEIKVSQTNSKETIQVYLSKLSSLINSEDFLFQKNGATVLSEAFKTSNFSKLNAIIKLNNFKIEQLRQLTVPDSLKETHKQALKITILARNIFISIRGLENDPIKAFLFSQRTDEVFNDWLNLLNKISDLIKEYNISL